jgi:hypothetical protein
MSKLGMREEGCYGRMSLREANGGPRRKAQFCRANGTPWRKPSRHRRVRYGSVDVAAVGLRRLDALIGNDLLTGAQRGEKVPEDTIAILVPVMWTWITPLSSLVTSSGDIRSTAIPVPGHSKSRSWTSRLGGYRPMPSVRLHLTENSRSKIPIMISSYQAPSTNPASRSRPSIMKPHFS